MNPNKQPFIVGFSSILELVKLFIVKVKFGCGKDRLSLDVFRHIDFRQFSKVNFL